MSYGTLPDWRAYASQRGDDAPANATDALAGQALLRAQDYIRINYVGRFTNASCSVDMPEVAEAVYVAASLELATPNFFTKTITVSDVKILTKVDAIEWTPVKTDGGMDAMLPKSSKIEALLGACVTGGAESTKHVGIYSI